MSHFFSYKPEKRYAQFPRRYLVEYHVDGRSRAGASSPDAKGACATLKSARNHATNSIDDGFCGAAFVFDRKIGQYIIGYKGNAKEGVRKFDQEHL